MNRKEIFKKKQAAKERETEIVKKSGKITFGVMAAVISLIGLNAVFFHHEFNEMYLFSFIILSGATANFMTKYQYLKETRYLMLVFSTGLATFVNILMLAGVIFS